MRLAALRLLSLAAAVFLLPGCSSDLHTGTTTSTSSNLTGDWGFGITDPGPGPFAITELDGALSGGGQNITGVFQAASGTGCVSPTFDITFTGTQDDAGDLTLTSTNLPGNVATITVKGTAFADGNTDIFGSLVITGSGPCAEPSIALLGGEYPNITGTYTGSLTAGSGASTPFTVTFSESAANSDGQFPTTGTLTVTGVGCANVFSLTGLVSGPNLNANLTLISGPQGAGTLSSSFVAQQSPPTFAVWINGSGCNANGYTGSLAKQ
ncbi:MAG: hypothetical protein ABSG84_14650 [Acidobacteriaceae bacterium]|jgi:hypothetical protein